MVEHNDDYLRKIAERLEEEAIDRVRVKLVSQIKAARSKLANASGWGVVDSEHTRAQRAQALAEIRAQEKWLDRQTQLALADTHSSFGVSGWELYPEVVTRVHNRDPANVTRKTCKFTSSKKEFYYVVQQTTSLEQLHRVADSGWSSVLNFSHH